MTWMSESLHRQTGMAAVNWGLTRLMVRAGILCLLAGPLVSGEEKKIYAAKDEPITLKLDQLGLRKGSKPIIWKHNKDKVVELFDGEEPFYFRFFNSTTTLDIETWDLFISNLQPNFSGIFSAQVGYKDSPHAITLVAIDAVHVNGLKGKFVTLKPEVPNVHVSFVQWSLNNTVIAQWEEEDMSSRTLSQSMVLDNGTFSLTISALLLNHTGLYTFTVDNQLTASYYVQIKDDGKDSGKYDGKQNGKDDGGNSLAIILGTVSFAVILIIVIVCIIKKDAIRSLRLWRQQDQPPPPQQRQNGGSQLLNMNGQAQPNGDATGQGVTVQLMAVHRANEDQAMADEVVGEDIV